MPTTSIFDITPALTANGQFPFTSQTPTPGLPAGYKGLGEAFSEAVEEAVEEQHGFELNLEPSRVRVELNANEQALCPEARCGSV